MNVPYKKVLDADGNITNPIVGKYVNSFPNRATRNKVIPRNISNKAGVSLVAHKNGAYKRIIQNVPIFKNYVEIEGEGKKQKEGFGKIIKFRQVVHYVLKKVI